jgi:hypothetical protein
MPDLISNAFGPTHAERLAELVAAADEVLLVSPFLFEDFQDWVSKTDFARVKSVTLVSTLAPRGDDQLRKPTALISFIEAMRNRWPKVRLTIQIDNKLHGKVYIFSRGGSVFRGIITSANLTRSGLLLNHEWGLDTDDASILEGLRQQIAATVEYPHLSEDLLRMMLMFVDQWKRDHPHVPENVDVDASLINALKFAPRKTEPDELMESGKGVRQIFLKPWGTKDEPVLKSNRETFGGIEDQLDFPKGRPADLRVGDLVVAFGTGSRCVLSVYRVLRPPQERAADEQLRDPHAARWPWFVPGQNITPRFGASWWEQDLTIDELGDEYEALHRGAPLTAAGARSFGAFNYGAGRLRLNPEFGEYVLNRLLKIESRLGGREP